MIGFVNYKQMKVTYIIEKTSPIDSLFLIKRITSKLQVLDYNIISKSETKVIFNYRGWKLIPAGKNKVRISEGKFELLTFSDGTMVKLTYSISLIVQIIMLALSVIISFFIINALFIVIVAVLIFAIDYFMTKTRAEELLNEVVNMSDNNI